MAREFSRAASVFKQKRQTLGVWSTSQKYKTQRRGHIFSHDSVVEPLSPWAVCFNYCLQSVVSLCCLEGRVRVSVNLSLFPSTFLTTSWVQNAYSHTWLQFLIFFFISSHFWSFSMSKIFNCIFYILSAFCHMLDQKGKVSKREFITF